MSLRHSSRILLPSNRRIYNVNDVDIKRVEKDLKGYYSLLDIRHINNYVCIKLLIYLLASRQRRCYDRVVYCDR
jgi:hypothetical protein